MNIKKLGTILFGCILAGTVLVGCGGQQGNKAATHDTQIKVGTLTHLNASEEKINEIMRKIDEETEVKEEPVEIKATEPMITSTMTS